MAKPIEYGVGGDPDEFYWVGFFIGNGSTNRRAMTVTMGNRKARYTRGAKARQFDRFVRAHGFIPQKWQRYRNHISITVEGVVWKRFLESRFGYDWRWRALTKRVPRVVWSASLECRKAFLCGLLDADGCVGDGSNGTPALHLCQRSLLAEVMLLLRTCGVESSLRGPYQPDSKRKDSISWRLNMNGLQLVENLSYGFRRKWNVTVRNMSVPASVTVPLQLVDIHKLTASQRVLRNRAIRGEAATPYTVAAIFAAGSVPLPHCYASYRLRTKRMLCRTETTYTLSVDDPDHRFDSEGVISKNSAADLQNNAVLAFNTAFPPNYQEHTGLVFQVHDQLVAECKESDAERVKKIVEDSMRRNFNGMLFPAAAKIGRDWKEVS
jgi:hypothetical protein